MMKNLHCNKSEQTQPTAYMYVLSHRSYDKNEDNYSGLLKTAHKSRRAKRFEEAGNAFIKAAEMAHSSSLEYTKVVGRYEDAAKCFLQISDDRALTCYMIAANIVVKNETIERGIECFVTWGYGCGQKLGDMNKAERFFQKADELRLEHKLSHVCVITEFEKSDLGSNVGRALKKAEEILDKFRVKEPIPTGIRTLHRSLCRFCIHAHERLQSQIPYLRRLRNEQQIKKSNVLIKLQKQKLIQEEREKIEQKEKEERRKQEQKEKQERENKQKPLKTSWRRKIQKLKELFCGLLIAK